MLKMLKIRIHGRGGQGSFVAAQILATAGFEEGYYTQASLHIRGGGDRRGAPVLAYVKMDKEKIREKTRIIDPDHVIVQDVTLFDVVDVLDGLKPTGVAILNSEKTPDELKAKIGIKNVNIKTVPASRIALEVTGSPITNTTILGAFAAATKELSIESIKKAILEILKGELGKKSTEPTQKAYNYMIEAKA